LHTDAPTRKVLIFIFPGAPIKPSDYGRLIGVNFAKVGEVIAGVRPEAAAV
jgi:hypothetical protein